MDNKRAKEKSMDQVPLQARVQRANSTNPAWKGTRDCRKKAKATTVTVTNDVEWTYIDEDTDLYWIADRELYDWDRQIRFSWQQSTVQQSGSKPRKEGLEPSDPFMVNRAYAAAIGKANTIAIEAGLRMTRI